MTLKSDSDGIEKLATSVQSTRTLCDQLALALAEVYKNPSTAPHDDTSKIQPIALSRDATTLIRAHSTKISLLIINEPFTPSAIADVLRGLQSGPVLGVASAVQACDPTQYTAFFRKELAWRSKRVLTTLSDLLGQIPTDGKVLSGSKKEKGSLPSTGILWSACDELVALANMGVGQYITIKSNEWKDTLKDVMEELKEWGDEEPDDDDSDEDDDDDNDGIAHEADQDQDFSTAGAQDMLDDLMSLGQAIPRDDPKKIRPRLESTLRRVRMLVLLYQAITKRRLKALPSLPLPSSSPQKNVPQRLDEAAAVLGELPDSFGELASSFYEMDPAAIDKSADECFFAAFAAGELLSLSWDGEQDEFSEWVDKFKAEIRKA